MPRCKHTHTDVLQTCISNILQVIAANGERSASEKLRQAADIIDESPAALQLRYLQTLNTISAENNHTYVFPLPIDLLMRLFSKQ